jgi:hypothetical protein
MPPLRSKPQRLASSYRDLRADLDHPVGGKLKVARRVIGVFGEDDEQPVLPDRHPRFWIR